MKNEREIADMKWKIDPHEVTQQAGKLGSRVGSRAFVSLILVRSTNNTNKRQHK